MSNFIHQIGEFPTGVSVQNSSGSIQQGGTGVTPIVAMDASFIIGAILILLIDFIAITGNSVMLLAIFSSKRLRTQLSNFFLVNLFTVDLLGATFCLSPSIACFIMRTWRYSDNLCQIWGFTKSLIMYVSVSTIGVISVERYYSISAPMRHAAHLTLGRTIFTIGCVWTLSFIAAILPILGWDDYSFSYSTYMCGWSRTSAGYVMFTLILSFVFPGSVMSVMYCAIWRVAKRTASQLHPVLESTDSSELTIRIGGTLLTVPMSPVIRLPCHPDVINNAGLEAGTIPSVCHDVQVPEQRTLSFQSVMHNGVSPTVLVGHQTNASHWRAVRTVVLVLTVFWIHWVPYCVVSIIAVMQNPVTLPPYVELVITWLALSSYAVNPLIYGWRNRTIRDALEMSYDTLRARVCKREPGAREPPPNEDFFQFLERTSVHRQCTE